MHSAVMGKTFKVHLKNSPTVSTILKMKKTNEWKEFE